MALQKWDETKKQIDESVAFIRKQTTTEPTIGIILGTGLGSLVDGIEMETTVAYDQIPHFPVSTVESHHGRLLFGNLRGKRVVCMQGRFHFYEGYSMQQVVFPVRVMKALGIKTLVVSNAAGGVNPNYVAGDIMLIKDHINFFGTNPLIGQNHNDWGSRFPDMFEAYSPILRAIAHETALEQNLRIQEGVYLGLSGPTLETAAEYRMVRVLGADAVGMSTVPEVIAARHQGTDVLGFTIITDMGLADAMKPCSIDEVLRVAGEAEPKLRELIAGCVERM